VQHVARHRIESTREKCPGTIKERLPTANDQFVADVSEKSRGLRPGADTIICECPSGSGLALAPKISAKLLQISTGVGSKTLWLAKIRLLQAGLGRYRE
jgi:hypothetical protein